MTVKKQITDSFIQTMAILNHLSILHNIEFQCKTLFDTDYSNEVKF